MAQVLPYVYRGAVEHFAWLTAAQMIDGLALGETTPGPLIMVVAFVGFVGFVGGWAKEVLRPEAFKVGVDIFGVSNWLRTSPAFTPAPRHRASAQPPGQ